MSHTALLQPLHALFWEGKFCSVHSYTTLLIFVCFSHFIREPRQAARSSQVFLCDSASLAGRAWKNQPHCKRDKRLGKAKPLPWLCVSTRGVTSLVWAETEISVLTGGPRQGRAGTESWTRLFWAGKVEATRGFCASYISFVHLHHVPFLFSCPAILIFPCHFQNTSFVSEAGISESITLPACCKNQPNQPETI